MYRLKQLILLTGDLCVLYVGLFLSVSIRYANFSSNEFIKLFPSFGFIYAVAVITMFIVGLYDATQTRNSYTFFQKIIISTIIWSGLGIFYFYLNPNVSVTPKTILLINSAVSLLFVSLWRYIYNSFLAKKLLNLTLVFAGDTPEAQEIISMLQQQPEHGYTVKGVISESSSHATQNTTTTYATSLTLLKEKIGSGSIDFLILSPSYVSNSIFLKELYSALFKQTQVIELADFYETIMQRIPPFTFSEAWFLTHLREQQKKIYDRLRILIDYILAFFLAGIFIATFPFIALGIKITSPGPIFFKQKRVGKNQLLFTLYKYRSMKALTKDGSAELAGPQFATEKDPRITKFGNFLRLTRLDELPQFINIFKNEMGLIGPRPERPEFVQQLTQKMPFYALRHLIKPGLTGWAQLNKAYYGTLDENLRKLEYDLYYIKHRGPLLDISIFLKTINIVVKMKGR